MKKNILCYILKTLVNVSNAILIIITDTFLDNLQEDIKNAAQEDQNNETA